jgi:maltose/moltooligosaccharide transporter
MACTPMLVFAATITFMYEQLLGGDPRNVLRLGGMLMLFAAIAIWRVRQDKSAQLQPA